MRCAASGLKNVMFYCLILFFLFCFIVSNILYKCVVFILGFNLLFEGAKNMNYWKLCYHCRIKLCILMTLITTPFLTKIGIYRWTIIYFCIEVSISLFKSFDFTYKHNINAYYTFHRDDVKLYSTSRSKYWLSSWI